MGLLSPSAAQNDSEEKLGLETTNLIDNSSLFRSSGDYLSGWFASRRGDFKNASDFYSRVLEKDDERFLLLEKTLMLKIQSGDIETAQNIAKRLISINEDHSLSRLVLSLKDFKEGRYKEARKYLDNLGKRPIDLLSSSMISAWSYVGEGSIRDAIISLSRLSARKMFDQQKTYHGALIADRFDRKDAAVKLYEQAYKKSKNATRSALAYGNFLKRNGSKKAARNIYERLLKNSSNNYLIHAELDGLNSPRSRWERPFILGHNEGAAEALLNIAELLRDQSNQEYSILYLQLALYLRPKFADAYMMIGSIHDKNNRYQDALDAYSQIPPNSPWQIEAEIRMAINNNLSGKTDFAVSRLQILTDNLSGIITYEPNLVAATMLKDKERFSEAADIYSRAINLLDNPTRKHWNVFYFRGICYSRLDKWEKAEADFFKALELFPNQPQVLNYVGYSWIEMGKNFDEALEMINDALEQRPADGYIVDSAGWAHYKLGNYSEAVNYLEQAVGLQPGDMVINDHLGDAYWRVGRKLEAQFQWRRALSIAEDEDDVKEFQNKIDEGLPELDEGKDLQGVGIFNTNESIEKPDSL